MSIRKDVTVKITNNNATLDMPLQIYELDHGIELRFKLMDYKYKYTKDPQNILNSSDEDILEAYTTIINPRGYELQQINGEVKDDIVIFMIDSSYTDEIDEIGTYSLQIHIKCACSEFSIPPIQFEVLQRLKGIKVVTDGEDSIDDSALIDNYSNFISDETGKLLIEWKKGDIISSVKLNAMVEVINNAVDEEVQRQANEVKREQQELERQNSVQEALNSVDNRVDEAMNEYETRFNALTASQQQDMEVIDARDGEVSLKARLDRDLRNPLQVYEDVEGSYISCDSTEGYLKDIEIIGNTIQNQNDLADIRSVGDKLENQELYEIPVLSTNENIFNGTFEFGAISTTTGANGQHSTFVRQADFIYLKKGKYRCIVDDDLSKRIDCYVYSEDKSFIERIVNTQKGFNLNQNSYVRFADNGNLGTLNFNIMLTVGTEFKSYIPRQEHKLTILSPTPLEKVGDVADRIICKDGVWGVEKNIGTVYYKDLVNLKETTVKKDNFLFVQGEHPNLTLNNYNVDGNTVLCSKKFLHSFEESEHMWYDSASTTFRFAISKEITSVFDSSKIIEYYTIENVFMKIQLKQSAFIPLPYDQQVKLRTFANKTNISFGCEIEPTLKASVPKSLSSTVSTHTEQIDNLGKELDKVKKLEESTASTVTTESDFTTVTETSNGYFEDVKLEGKTLVNLVDKTKGFFSVGMLWTPILKTDKNKKVTVFVRVVNEDTSHMKVAIYRHGADNVSLGAFIPYNKSYINNQFIVDFSTDSITDFFYYTIYIHNHNGVEYLPMERDNIDIMVLEGDHTQNPPAFFEGLKSVGQDVDEISVLSCNENLFNADDVISEDPEFYKCNEYIKYKASGDITILKNDFAYNTVYTFKLKASSNRQGNTISMNFSCKYTDGTIDIISIGNCKPDTIYTKTFTSAHGKTIKELTNTHNASETITLYLDGTSIIKGEQSKPYTPHKQDKKRILYYNPTTDTWEKPVLREWDSIEKHSDGKYYYHKRSGEVVLDGSENWRIRPDVTDDGAHAIFSVFTSFKYNKSSYMICDKFNPKSVGNVNEAYSKGEGISYYNYGTNSDYTIYYVISKSKLTSQDTQGFAQWLQANPITLVYQLETEEVYECTSIDLMTYKNETNYIVTAGAIAPVSTLKVMCNINNVVRELQQKVSNLENYIQHVMIDALNNALNE